MSNYKRSSLYIHFDAQDEEVVSTWLPLLSDQWWKVMDSGQGVHVAQGKILAECDLVVLCISKNIYTPDGEVKPEIQDFFNTAIQVASEKIILITLDEAKIPDGSSDKDLVVYQHRNDASTVHFFEYLRNQTAQKQVADLQKIVEGLQVEQRKAADQQSQVLALLQSMKGGVKNLEEQFENLNQASSSNIAAQTTFILQDFKFLSQQIKKLTLQFNIEKINTTRKYLKSLDTKISKIQKENEGLSKKLSKSGALEYPYSITSENNVIKKDIYQLLQNSARLLDNARFLEDDFKGINNDRIDIDTINQNLINDLESLNNSILDVGEELNRLSQRFTDLSQNVINFETSIQEDTKVSTVKHNAPSTSIEMLNTRLFYFMVFTALAYVVTLILLFTLPYTKSFYSQVWSPQILTTTPLPSEIPTLTPTDTPTPTSTFAPTATETETPMLTFTNTVIPSNNLTPTHQIKTPTRVPSPAFTPEVSVTVNLPTPTVTKVPTQPPFTPTVNATQALLDAFSEADAQFEKSFQGNIVFNKPEKMNKEETTSIELILSPSLSETDLVTQIIERGDFVTSTADADLFVAPNGTSSRLETEQIEITNYIKAELKSQNPDALIVTDMLNAEQLISLTKPTTWRWSVTAKKEGKYTLELIITQLVKYGEEKSWTEVESFTTDIVVDVAPTERVKSWDWKWLISLLGIPALWTLVDNWKKKKAIEKIRFPLEIHAEYEGAIYEAEMRNLKGEILLNGMIYPSPTAAALTIVTNGKHIKGRLFWKYENPETKKWEYINNLKVGF